MSLDIKRIKDRVRSAVTEIVTDEVAKTVFADVEKVVRSTKSALGGTERRKPGPKKGAKKSAKIPTPVAATRGKRYEVSPAQVLELVAAAGEAGTKSEDLRKAHFAKLPPAVLARALKKLVTGGQIRTTGEKRAMVYAATGAPLPIEVPTAIKAAKAKAPKAPKASLSEAREAELAAAAEAAKKEELGRLYGAPETASEPPSEESVSTRLLSDNTLEAE